MSNETREVRGKVPAAVADRIDQAFKILGAPMHELVGKAVEAGLETTLRGLAVRRAAELAAFLPQETIVVREDEPEKPKPGRAEKAAAVRTEELKEQRRRQRSPSKTPRDPVN